MTRAAGVKPLVDVRVLDISNFLAAPLGAMFLADFGADVIKVERPGRGDEVRYWGNAKDGVGLYYKVINRNKRAITLDLHTPIGVEAVKRLVKSVAIVVENYRPGTLERWGLGYDVLSAENPALVMVRVTGFGQTGPHRERPGFGTLAEAYAGYAHISGDEDGPPLLPGFGLTDATTGLWPRTSPWWRCTTRAGPVAGRSSTSPSTRPCSRCSGRRSSTTTSSGWSSTGPPAGCPLPHRATPTARATGAGSRSRAARDRSSSPSAPRSTFRARERHALQRQGSA